MLGFHNTLNARRNNGQRLTAPLGRALLAHPAVMLCPREMR